MLVFCFLNIGYKYDFQGGGVTSGRVWGWGGGGPYPKKKGLSILISNVDG